MSARVTLLNATVDPEKLLIFTKGTRLGLSAHRWDSEHASDQEWIDEQLAYIANTIPSSWEFVDYTFLIEGVSRAFTHQFVRNRHGSYAQESMRVTDQGDFGFVWPERIKKKHQVMIGEELLYATKEYYQALVAEGVAPEDARAFLPTNIATNIVAKFNLRTLSELAKSRLGGRTQGEYREVMDAICSATLERHPWVEQFFFGDRDRDYFDEIEQFAEEQFGGDLLTKGKLLKIVDKMRKS